MATVTEDNIEGGGLSVGPDGYVATRIFTVDGVTGDKKARMYNAILTAKIPRRGDLHPVIPGLRVDTLNAVPLSASQFRVTCVYKNLVGFSSPVNAAPTLAVGSSVTGTTTNKAYGFVEGTGAVENGLMIVKYTATNDDGSTTEKTQTGEIELQVPQTVYNLSRKEKGDPGNKALNFVGTVNSTTFRGWPARHWLCTRIQGQSQDGGETWQVDYEFQFNREKWDATVVYVDPETNEVPKSPIPSKGNGIAVFKPYPEQNFVVLGVG